MAVCPVLQSLAGEHEYVVQLTYLCMQDCTNSLATTMRAGLFSKIDEIVDSI